MSRNAQNSRFSNPDAPIGKEIFGHFTKNYLVDST